MVHELFLAKCAGEHLRKWARVGIKENEASEVAESRAGKSRLGRKKEGQDVESFWIRAHLKISHQMAPKGTTPRG
jgi:hypothetical protein